MRLPEKAIQQREARLFRAYRELERLDGEQGGPVIMPYDVAQQFKGQLLERVRDSEGCRHA